MGMIPFIAAEPVATSPSSGFTRLSRQPDGQGEPYQPLDLPLETSVIPVVEEAVVKEPERDTTEQSLPEVVEQLHAFTHMPPVFVRHEEARLLATRQSADPLPQGVAVHEVGDGSPSVSAALRALSGFERQEADRTPVVMPTEGGKERASLLTGEVVRVLNQTMGQDGKQPPSDKLAVGLPPLPGAERTSERDALITDLKAMVGQQVPTSLARAAEYQWAPARLADSPAQWGQQLVEVLKDKVELQVNQSIKQAHIRLDPPELGRLELTVRVDGDRLNVQLNVTNPAVREALIQSMERLRMSLAPHHAGGVEVNVGQGGEQSRGDRWQQQDEILAGRRQWQEEPGSADDLARDWLNTLV